MNLPSPLQGNGGHAFPLLNQRIDVGNESLIVVLKRKFVSPFLRVKFSETDNFLNC